MQFGFLFFPLYVRMNFETTLKIGNGMESLQKIFGLTDDSGEINNDNSEYIQHFGNYCTGLPHINVNCNQLYTPDSAFVLCFLSDL